MKIKTIDVNAKEWRDKVNGNSYFSARITLNYGMKNEQIICLPFQYGYGSHNEWEAMTILIKNGFIPKQEGVQESLWRYCDEHKIILRTNKIDGCLKRDVVDWGKP